VLWNVGRNLKKVMTVFLQTAPESFDAEEFEEKVTALPDVQATHHVHVWSLDGENHVLSAHVVMSGGATREQILGVKARVREMLDEDKFIHVTLDVELEGEKCLARRDAV
jgi:cobalt-zinc-cadmium efflux system protein